MKRFFRICATGLLCSQLVTAIVPAGIALAQPFNSSSTMPSLFSSSSTMVPVAQQGVPTYAVPQDTYFTDALGNILMNVNVWGEVYKPGQVVVKENADIAAVLSLVGGPKDSANLKKVRVNRQQADENGKQTFDVNLKEYYREGDRSTFVALKPNDTIIIPEDKGVDTDMVLRIVGIAVSIATAYAVAND
jgi:hypothetical protein